MQENLSNIPFHHKLRVTGENIDQNGHVNNVVYIQWMQDVAILHSEKCGGTAAMEQFNATWVVRSHTIDYLSPAFAGDLVIAETWVANFRKVRSLRKYKFIRKSDSKVLATGETDWVMISIDKGRPLAVPEEVQICFPLLPEYS